MSVCYRNGLYSVTFWHTDKALEAFRGNNIQQIWEACRILQPTLSGLKRMCQPPPQTSNSYIWAWKLLQAVYQVDNFLADHTSHSIYLQCHKPGNTNEEEGMRAGEKKKRNAEMRDDMYERHQLGAVNTQTHAHAAFFL